MELSTTTQTYIAAVRQFSGNQLKREHDCALLTEIAHTHALDAELAELCFIAKFLHKTVAIMKRIGPMGEGYDKLAFEFSANVEKSQLVLAAFAERMHEVEQSRFRKQYLEIAPASLEALIELAGDLAWMKNYALDAKGRA
jgi:hypothetical protein